MLSAYQVRRLATKPIRTVTSPAVPFEPVSIEEVRRQCNLAGNTAHDAAWNRLMAASRETVERDAGIVCATGTYTFRITDFGNGDWLELPSNIRPISAVGSIAYVDSLGATTTWSGSEYSLDLYTVTPSVKLGYGYSWPVPRGDINEITVTVTAGYASQALVPAQAKQACLLLISHWFENRGIVGQVGPEIAMSYASLIACLKVPEYA